MIKVYNYGKVEEPSSVSGHIDCALKGVSDAASSDEDYPHIDPWWKLQVAKSLF